MQKTSQRELDPFDERLLEKTEELRTHLLGIDGIRESVSMRAYELYERRGADPGLALEDWVQAENEVLLPLIEQKLKRPRETTKETAGNVTPAKLSSQEPKAAPKKKPISGPVLKFEAAKKSRVPPK